LLVASLVSSPAFAQADAVRGKKAYETSCSICHSLTTNGIGPSHQGVYGRKAGSMAGYVYSPGFAKVNLVWDEKTLDAWIAFPENLVPGQKMGFYVMEADVRADIIAYLKSLAAPSK
jgi:cytochrome c